VIKERKWREKKVKMGSVGRERFGSVRAMKEQGGSRGRVLGVGERKRGRGEREKRGKDG
jgi:hypothetical protein